MSAPCVGGVGHTDHHGLILFPLLGQPATHSQEEPYKDHCEYLTLRRDGNVIRLYCVVTSSILQVAPGIASAEPLIRNLFLLHPTYPTILLQLASTTDTAVAGAGTTHMVTLIN